MIISPVILSVCSLDYINDSFVLHKSQFPVVSVNKCFTVIIGIIAKQFRSRRVNNMTCRFFIYPKQNVIIAMERLVGVKQSLRLDGKKVCNIKMVGISQAESNNIKACVVPSIHLPLTREARVMVQSKG